MEELSTNPVNFVKNRARDMPLHGVYIPKIRKIFSFGGSGPTL